MKTIICNEPNQFSMIEVPAPARKPGDALVRIKRIGICGTDIHAFHGNQPYFTYPRILGHELAGIIEAVDADVPGLAVGTQVSVIPYVHCGHCIACRAGRPNCCASLRVIGVHTDGGMAEYITMPTTHLLPTADLSLEQSAILEPLSIGAHAVRRSNLGPNDTALVIGAGPIGFGVMAFAKLRGATVIAMDVNDERLDVSRDFAQVDATVNARDNPVEQVVALTDGDFPVVVFDATGNAASMSAAVHYVAHGGTLVYVGLVKGDVSISDPELHQRELTLLSSRNATLEDFAVVHDAVAKGQVDTNHYITHRVAFDDVIYAFEGLTQPATKVIKAVIEL